jgi:acyl-coenzyme A thioesterase 13
MDENRARSAFESAMTSYQQEFNNFFLARLHGLNILYDDNENCVIDFTVEEFMFNPQGSLHGGVIALVMDISMGHLLNHHIGPGATLEMNIKFVRAVRAGRAQAKGQFLKKGKEICFLRSDLYDDQSKLIAFATSTWKLHSNQQASGKK